MTDLEITKLCAEAMGYQVIGQREPSTVLYSHPNSSAVTCFYQPIHDDAQAMALVKKLRLRVLPQANGHWCVDNGEPTPYARGAYWLASAETLARAACECASQMQKAK